MKMSWEEGACDINNLAGSLDTLLKAVEYVEQHQSKTNVLSRDNRKGQEAVSQRIMSGRENFTFTKPVTPSRPTSLNNQPLVSLLQHQKKRQPSQLKPREVHKYLEKNRRARIRRCFELLKEQLPISDKEKKISDLTILRSAVLYIQELKMEEKENEHELEQLERLKISASQQLANLKKDLSVTCEFINFTVRLQKRYEAEARKRRE